jgi:hypothetical protein
VADFTSLKFQLNTGTNAAPVWTDVPAAGAGTGQELRYSDSSAQGAVASASWPAVTGRPQARRASITCTCSRPTPPASACSAPRRRRRWRTSNTAQYRFLRLNWDNTGTFASAPIFTAYPSTAHGAVTRGDGSVLGGHASDTGGTARSYLKGNAFGRVDSAGVPAAAPTNAPTVTDGSTGSLSPTAGANWLTNFQSLQGDNDYITAPFTPAATTADQWSLIIRLFIGANSSPGVSTPVISCRYTYS